MEKVKIGIIGCGVISHTYIFNIKKMYHMLDIVACADMIIEKAELIVQQYELACACSVDELLENPDIQIVVNLTIPAAHNKINQMILNAGKHVYCEKPLALDLEDAKKTVELAMTKNLMLGCAPETFLGAGLQTCRKIIDEGWIGKPLFATANMVSSGPETWHCSPEFFYKKGGGPMLDVGPYYVTALVALLGPVKKIGCFSSMGKDQRPIYSEDQRGQIIDVEVPTTYTGIMTLESGVIVNINMSFDVWLSSLPKLEIYGTNGSILIPDPNMFGGQIKIFRKEKVLDSISSQLYTGEGHTYSVNYDDLQEIPQIYEQPLENMRGIGILDMANALLKGTRHRLNEELALHVTEALLGFDKCVKEDIIYKMESSCTRPEPL